MQASHQFAEFAFSTGPGQGGMAHVVFQVDGVVFDPDARRVLAERLLQSLVPWLRELAVAAKAGHQLAHEVLWGINGQFELQQAAHMVGRCAGLCDNPGGVQRVESKRIHEIGELGWVMKAGSSLQPAPITTLLGVQALSGFHLATHGQRPHHGVIRHPTPVAKSLVSAERVIPVATPQDNVPCRGSTVAQIGRNTTPATAAGAEPG